MLESHLTVYEDAAGTIIGHRPGQKTDAPVVMLGSHFDSVKMAAPLMERQES